MARRASSPSQPAAFREVPDSVPNDAPISVLATDTLEGIATELQACSRCKLCSGRKTVVVGEGNPRAELVFVGEGPGEQEDLQGRPFVGKAGQLLDRMIQAMGFEREQVFIANVVKCRPPGNRNPEPDELESCYPFLMRQLDVIRPKAMVALGKFAAQTLLQTDERITKLRGSWRTFERPGWSAQLMPTFHPAYLLRNPESKREAWADLQQICGLLGRSVAARAAGTKGAMS